MGKQVKGRAQSFPWGKLQEKACAGGSAAEGPRWVVMLQRAFVGNSEQLLSF